MAIYVTEIELPGAAGIGENPLPPLRDAAPDKEVACLDSMPEFAKRGLGEATGERVLPYLTQDRYGREEIPLARKAIIIENNILRAVFLPWCGGKLYSLTERATGRELLYKNSVFRPANLAIRDAWTSGGVEWNMGQYGHCFTTCSDVYFARVEADGAEFLRMYEFERQKRVYWLVDIHLPNNSAVLWAHVRIINIDKIEKPTYWWTNIACVEADGCRVFSGADDVIFQTPDGFGWGRMPDYSGHSDFDASYPRNFPRSGEQFFQTSADEISPWEAAAYPDGFMFFERSTAALKYRKLFCWGVGRGGRFWCDYLSRSGQGDYMELQAGLARTQLHGHKIAAEAEIEFTQAFSFARANMGANDIAYQNRAGAANVDADAHCLLTRDSANRNRAGTASGGLRECCPIADDAAALFGDWQTARDAARKIVDGALGADTIEFMNSRLDAISRARADKYDILHIGSGWGALERLRGNPVPHETVFTERSDILAPYVNLIETGKLGALGALPKAYADESYLDLLKKDESPDAAYMRGVIYFELYDYENAKREFEAALKGEQKALALRNLSILLAREGFNADALKLAHAAYEVGRTLDPAFFRECAMALISAGDAAGAWRLFEDAPISVKSDDRSRLIIARAALAEGRREYLAELLAQPHSAIREGEELLTDLWFGYQALLLADARGVAVTDKILREVKRDMTPPRDIDFRMK